MNILHSFVSQTAQIPDAPALITAKARISFGALEHRSAQAAQMLHTLGLRRGDIVLVIEPMSVCLYEILLALFRLGLVAMFVDPQSGRNAIAQALARCRPKALIATGRAQLLRLLHPAIAGIPLKLTTTGWIPGTTSWRRVSGFAPRPEITEVDASHPALITFTSGSTGHPRAAVRTHGFLCHQHRVLEKNIALQQGRIDLATLPVFVLANLGSGVSSLIPDADLRRPGFVDAGRVLRQIRHYQPQRSAGSPAFYLRLAQALDETEKLTHFEAIYTGGAPIYPCMLKPLRRMAPQAKLVVVYGSTEAEPIAHYDASRLDTRDYEKMVTGGGLVVGHPVDEIQLRIIRMQWGEPIGTLSATEFLAMQLPAGQTGEIVVSGAHVLPGYLDGAGDRETKFEVEGQKWHRTGDAGYLDRRQRLWLMGRCAARISDRHGEVYPFAVEAAALETPTIRHAALVSLREQRTLVIECDRGQKTDHRALLQRLAWAKLERIEQVDSIPMDRRHNAKVDYPALYRMLR